MPASRIIAALACLWPLLAPAGTLTLDGPLEQGGAVIGRAPPGTAVSLQGRRLSVSREGVFLMGFGRDAPPTERLDVAYPDGSVEHRELKITQRDYPTERINGLEPSQVTPPEEVLARIRREQARIEAARELDAPRTDFTTSFIRPVPGRISGVFGSQRILNGKSRRPHYGVDFAVARGTPIKAPAPGVVTLVDKDMYFSGGTVILDHGHGLSSVFIHMSRIDVKEGQRVEQGGVIGAVGATGRATGPHLHWGVNWFQERLDPQLLLQ